MRLIFEFLNNLIERPLSFLIDMPLNRLLESYLHLTFLALFLFGNFLYLFDRNDFTLFLFECLVIPLCLFLSKRFFLLSIKLLFLNFFRFFQSLFGLFSSKLLEFSFNFRIFRNFIFGLSLHFWLCKWLGNGKRRRIR
jgi:hypothetical protein